MQKTKVIELLTKAKPLLIQKFGITRMALFGSTARDEATENSDIDILISFDGIATSERYFGVQFYLEDCFLGYEIDLVTDKALRSQLRPFIEQEAIDV